VKAWLMVKAWLIARDRSRLPEYDVSGDGVDPQG
jgi:hypothetical protein